MDKKKSAIIINVVLLIIADFFIIINVVLLVWYFLSMVGLKIGNKYLVESAFKDEWIFMFIPTLTLLLFVFWRKAG